MPPRPKTDSTGSQDLVTLGVIAGAFGVKGWIKVHSDTQNAQDIFTFSPWWLKDGKGNLSQVGLLEGRPHSDALIARLEGVDDRDAASSLKGSAIMVSRDALPALAGGEYYWSDLIGLSVSTLTGECLGKIRQLMETGANDVMLICNDAHEHALPYIPQVVKKVDLDNGRMEVDWDTDI